jgi:uncharacterized phage infection (PIP) family protein YhgE
MTRIDQIQTGTAPGAGEGQKAQRNQGDQAFQQILQQAASRAGESPQAAQGGQGGQAAQAPAFDPMATLQGVKPALATAADLSPQQTEGLMHAERALETLERYEQVLGDERKSLKDVAALVRDLDGEVKGLTQALDKLDPQDKLYGLLQEVAVTSMVESIKFNRGDYLPTEPEPQA